MTTITETPLKRDAVRSQLRTLAMDFLVPPDDAAAAQLRERRRDQLIGLIALHLLDIEDAIREAE